MAALTPLQVTNNGNQRALQQLLADVLAVLRNGDRGEAREKLAHAARRTDGCVLRNAPDGNGADCAAQSTLYDYLIAALEALAV